MEEEFELKEEEPWYDRQDLEHGTGAFEHDLTFKWQR